MGEERYATMMQSLQYLRQALQDPLFVAQIAVLVACPALACVVGIWAATSRQHWFLRALAVWAVVAIMVPIRAYEPAWLFAASLPLIVAVLGARQRWKSRRTSDTTAIHDTTPETRFRFGTRDLLLLTLLVGLWLVVLIPIVPHFRADRWYGWVVSSFGLAAISALAYGCITSHRRRRAISLLLCALPAVGLAVWSGGNWLRVMYLLGVSGATTTLFADLVFLTLAGAELSLIVIGATALGRAALAPARAPRWRLLCAIVLALGTLGAGIPLGYLYARLLETAPRAPKFEIANNHFHRIRQIAYEIRALNPQNVSLVKLKLSVPKSNAPQQVASLYVELLPLLGESNAVDFGPDRGATEEYLDSQLEDIQACRALARCLLAESEQARENSTYDSAADYALAIASLGTMYRSGGIMLEATFGAGIENVGQSQLAKLRREVSPTQSRKVIAALDRSLALHENLAAIQDRDAHFVDTALGWDDKLDILLSEFDPYAIQGSVSLEGAAMHSAASSALLQADLAIRLYHRERGDLPGDLQQLVPAYLPAVPVDPYSEQPLVYRSKSAGDFVLYSIGFDRQDNGGTFCSPTEYNNAQHPLESGLDLNLETIIWRK